MKEEEKREIKSVIKLIMLKEDYKAVKKLEGLIE